MTCCDFVPINGSNDYRCQACGRIVTDVTTLPIWATCRSQRPSAIDGDCMRLGAELRRQECPTCGGNVQIKVFTCAVRGECTIAKPLEGIACCQTCEQFEASA